MHFRHGYEIDVTVYSAEAEHVLIFNIAAVRPAVYFHRDVVLALADIFCYVELSVVVGSLTVAHLLAVHPQIHGTVHTVEMNVYLFVVPVGWQRELTTV